VWSGIKGLPAMLPAKNGRTGINNGQVKKELHKDTKKGCPTGGRNSLLL
jgi:hypothetical protein